jgi:hypothetical protein
MCIFAVSLFPCSAWADEGLHLGWEKYPGIDTSVSGGVEIGSTTIPFNIEVLAKDWVAAIDSVTGLPYYSWSLAAAYEVYDGQDLLFSIDSLNFVEDFDPYIRLNFAVTAGGSDTTFTLNSTVVSFATLTNPLAYASAGLTLTGDDNGATATGLYAGGKNYQAIYNGSSVYGNLVNSFSVGNTTATLSERLPTSGWQTIPGSVSSIQSQFKFTLSAADSASGTSRFEVMVPEPATLAILGLGGLLLRKRK